MSWDRAEARKGRFDGKFIIGVMTTGIYCLPSCAARPPKPQNVRLFTSEGQARAAGDSGPFSLSALHPYPTGELGGEGAAPALRSRHEAS